MAEIMLENLTGAELLRLRYQNLFAVTPNDNDGSMRVWESRRLIPFVGADHPGTLIEDAYVRLASFAPDQLALLYGKLAQIGFGQIIRE